ncbi:hypothetical protein C8R43DRAFT_944475 [Mycena crocata]|nr:hypothetical protein C8R43DRAFT_944475 [Mycena crocata]
MANTRPKRRSANTHPGAPQTKKTKDATQVCPVCPGGPSPGLCRHTRNGQTYLTTQQNVLSKSRSPRKAPRARAQAPSLLVELGMAPPSAASTSTSAPQPPPPPPGFQYMPQPQYYQQQVPPGYTLVPQGWPGYLNQPGYPNPPHPYPNPTVGPQVNPPAYGAQNPPPSQHDAQANMWDNNTAPPQIPAPANPVPPIDPVLLALSVPATSPPDAASPPQSPQSDVDDQGETADRVGSSDVQSEPATPTPKTRTRTTRAREMPAPDSAELPSNGSKRVTAGNPIHGHVFGALKGKLPFEIFRRKALPTALVNQPGTHFRNNFPIIIDRLERLAAETGAYMVVSGTSRGLEGGIMSFVSNGLRQEAPGDALALVNQFIKSVGAIKRSRGTEALALTKEVIQLEAHAQELGRVSEAALLQAADATNTIELQARIIAELQAAVAAAGRSTASAAADPSTASSAAGPSTTNSAAGPSK